MSEPSFHLFAYGTLTRDRGAALLEGCKPVRPATVAGTLYDIRGEYPALILYGRTPVHGQLWRCPTRVLSRLDEYEDVAGGLFRRIATTIDGIPCWLYVAGPRLAHELIPARRIASGVWRPSGER